MEIKFENGSNLESIEPADSKRSKRAAIYYYRKNPYEFIEDFLWSKTALISKDMDRVNVFAKKWRQLWKR